jgi:hypothetical protein
MIDCNQDDRGTGHSMPFSRRSFLAKTSCFGALYAVAKLVTAACVPTALCSDVRSRVRRRAHGSARTVALAIVKTPVIAFRSLCACAFTGTRLSKGPSTAALSAPCSGA